MKKIFFILLAILVLVPSFTFASVLQLGVIYGVNTPIYVDSEEPFSFDNIDFGTYALGADVRINAGPLQIQGECRGQFQKDFSFSSLNVPFSLALHADCGFLDILLGVGIWNIMNKTDDGWLFNGVEGSNFGESLLTAPLYYRVGLGFNIGILMLDLELSCPSGMSLKGVINEDEELGHAFIPKFENMYAKIALLFNLF